jgi:hypothetical protein
MGGQIICLINLIRRTEEHPLCVLEYLGYGGMTPSRFCKREGVDTISTSCGRTEKAATAQAATATWEKPLCRIKAYSKNPRKTIGETILSRLLKQKGEMRGKTHPYRQRHRRAAPASAYS